MASAVLATFVERLRESRLLEPSQIAELLTGRSKDEDPKALAKELVRRGWLTRYQASKVLQGQGAELFIGPYLILERIGEGSMGKVYKANHQTMRRTVALKLIRKDRLTNPNAVKRFYQEVQSAAQLVHANIVMAYDAGLVGSVYYMAMEYVEGIDLGRLVAESGVLPVAQACDFVRQVALGLQHAFERGMVHRDIKPANLLLTRAGMAGRGPGDSGVRGPGDSGRLGGATIKILDMGLARMSQGPRTDVTQEGGIVGTPDFLAPEQALNSQVADIRSDLYSLGCTFYYLLTARPPFQAGSMHEVLMKHQLEYPTPVRHLRPEVPAGVEAVVDRLIAKDPAERFQSPAELADALAPFSEATTIAKPRPAPQYHPVSMDLDFAGMEEPDAPGSMLDAVQDAAPLRPAVARRRKTEDGGLQTLVLTAGGVVLLIGVLFAGFLFRGAIWRLVTQPAADPNNRHVAQGSPAATGDQPPDPPRPAVTVPPRPETRPAAKPQPRPAARPKPRPMPARKPEMEPEGPKKLPVPSEAKQELALTGIKEKFKTLYAREKPADQIALAAALLEQSLTDENQVSQFVLLTESWKAAARGGDPSAALKAIELLDGKYAVAADELRLEAFQTTAKAAATPPVNLALARSVSDQITEAVAADKYDLADKLFKVLEESATNSKLPRLLASTQARGKELEAIKQEYPAFKKASDALNDNTEDADANLAAGKFLALFKGDWEKGLQLLALGADEKLKAIAEADAATPTEPAAQAELGTKWESYAATLQGLAKTQAYRRAVYWYHDAVGRLTGANKTRIQARLAELEKSLPNTKPDGTQLRFITVIDGSDTLRITDRELKWTHNNGQFPPYVKIGRFTWTPQALPVYKAGTLKLIGYPVDFSKAQLVVKRGRGKVTIDAGSDAVTVEFEDSRPGAEVYDIVITFD